VGADAVGADAVGADCIFCRIVAGEIPADVVLRSEHALAFRDLNPQAPVHVLVIPLRHVDNAATVSHDDAEVMADMVVAARRVAEAEGVADSGYRLVLNVGDDGGNTVGHLHLHVLGGRRLGWPPG
jgi:histidine triad (HIT) family protein